MSPLRVYRQYSVDVAERLHRRTRELIKQSLVRRYVSDIALVETAIRLRRHRRRQRQITKRHPVVRRQASHVSADDLARLLGRRSSDYLCAVCLALQIDGSFSQALDRLGLLVERGVVRSRTGTCQCCAPTRTIYGELTGLRRRY